MSNTQMWLLIVGIVFLFALACVFMATHWASFKPSSWIANDPHPEYDAHPGLWGIPAPDRQQLLVHDVVPSTPTSQRQRALAPIAELAQLHYQSGPHYCPPCVRGEWQKRGVPRQYPKGFPQFCEEHMPTLKDATPKPTEVAN